MNSLAQLSLVSDEWSPLKAFLLDYGSPEGALGRDVADFCARVGDGKRVPAYHEVVAAMHLLVAAIERAQDAGVDDGAIRAILGPARAIHADSHFVSRLQRWPRGYPGDFETIEYLCEAKTRIPFGSAAFFIEYHCLRNVSAQQHRNKVHWQSMQIVKALREKANARILSVACGSSLDFFSVRELIGRTPEATFVLNDHDADALALSRDRLSSYEAKIETVSGDVFRSIRALQRRAPFDLILAGGLFDYLDDRKAVWLLRQLGQLVAGGGKLCFTNIATGNPDRAWLEYVADWHLIERDEPAIRRLIAFASNGASVSLSLERDTTGLTHLITLTREL